MSRECPSPASPKPRPVRFSQPARGCACSPCRCCAEKWSRPDQAVAVNRIRAPDDRDTQARTERSHLHGIDHLDPVLGRVGLDQRRRAVEHRSNASLRTSSVFLANFQSIWVICPIFSSRVILPSSSSMSGVGTLARLAASWPTDRPGCLPTQSSTATKATSSARGAPAAGTLATKKPHRETVHRSGQKREGSPHPR